MQRIINLQGAIEKLHQDARTENCGNRRVFPLSLGSAADQRFAAVAHRF
jgi:hypothetical protein